jgi:sulfite exporter TauE/SafE
MEAELTLEAKLLLVFGISLIGSLHCASMCGVFVACAVGGAECGGNGGPPRRWLANVAYHLGRLFSYTVLGVACGALGGAAQLGGEMIGLQRVAAIGGGAIIVLIGLVGIVRSLGVRVGSNRVPSFVQVGIDRGLQRAVRFPLTWRAATIGLFTAALPCGWLWIFAAAAAGTGNPLYGGLVMIAFWAGTVPILAGIGQSIGVLRGLARPALTMAISVVIVALGVWTIVSNDRIAMAGRVDTRGLTAAELSETPACCESNEP